MPQKDSLHPSEIFRCLEIRQAIHKAQMQKLITSLLMPSRWLEENELQQPNV